MQFALGLFTNSDQVPVVGDPDPEKFIKVGRIYGEKLEPFCQWYSDILGLLQHPVIEAKPTDIAMDIWYIIYLLQQFKLCHTSKLRI
jgi:hypothetical protein